VFKNGAGQNPLVNDKTHWGDKGSDPVKVENQRIDYSAESVGDRKVVVPDFVTIDTVEQPFPDLPHGRYITRHTRFTESYSGYAASGS